MKVCYYYYYYKVTSYNQQRQFSFTDSLLSIRTTVEGKDNYTTTLYNLLCPAMAGMDIDMVSTQAKCDTPSSAVGCCSKRHLAASPCSLGQSAESENHLVCDSLHYQTHNCSHNASRSQMRHSGYTASYRTRFRRTVFSLLILLASISALQAATPDQQRQPELELLRSVDYVDTKEEDDFRQIKLDLPAGQNGLPDMTATTGQLLIIHIPPDAFDGNVTSLQVSYGRTQ